MAHGLGESLAERFELLHLPHRSFAEMRDAFGWSLERFLFYGACPGAAPLARDPARWASYISRSLIETTIGRDVLLLSRVDKPALMTARSGRTLADARHDHEYWGRLVESAVGAGRCRA